MNEPTPNHQKFINKLEKPLNILSSAYPHPVTTVLSFGCTAFSMWFNGKNAMACYNKYNENPDPEKRKKMIYATTNFVIDLLKTATDLLPFSNNMKTTAKWVSPVLKCAISFIQEYGCFIDRRIMQPLLRLIASSGCSIKNIFGRFSLPAFCLGYSP